MRRLAPISTGWSLALGATVALAVLAALPPIVGGQPGAFIHHAFSAVCHQIPERSPHLMGDPAALCHRCSGILLGLIGGLALSPFIGRGGLRRVARSSQVGWLLLAGVPTSIDWAVGALGWWANTPASRTLTGALFGLVAGGILAANLLTPRSPRTLSTSYAS